MRRRLALAAVAILVSATIAGAQQLNLSDLLPAGDASISGRIVQGIILLTVLSVAPGLLVTATCFTRFVVAFSFLRTGLGLQSTPSNLIVIALALFMTFYVMAPVFDTAWTQGVRPLVNGEITEEEAIPLIIDPLKRFMASHVRARDLELFADFAGADEPQAEDELPDLRLIVPAYMVSELRRAFEIGFLILLPFLVIDLIVATVTMSMGMMMLPPTVVSLPMKVLFFVLIDGWNLIVGQLLESVA
ncbi:MAG: flagellar biosynthetic protein FliP [Alphaproteobacteria bacterium]|nr:MAG: flagellar biosynthetic protein FliP [Alphaproteobacteria bacterium]